MPVSPVFERTFAKLYGKPCWGVKQGHGSFLTIEFGKPHLEIREPIVARAGASKKVRAGLARRGAYVVGEWHLWIYCCAWEVLLNGGQLAHSESSNSRIMRAANFLNGQKLVRFSIAPRGTRCIFEFDLGGVLKTWPYSRTDEQWLLYEPNGKVLALRADKRYSHAPSDRPEDQINWKSIQN
jgi:hypothetical protein